MKLLLKSKSSVRLRARKKNKVRVRKKVNGSTERPRLSVFRSGRHMYAQIVDDVNQKTLVSSSTLALELKKSGSKEAAQAMGKDIAKKALDKKISSIVFDRSGYLYHGRVKAVADGAREAGLKF